MRDGEKSVETQQLSGSWLGHIVGTNSGTVTVQLTQDGKQVRGEIALSDFATGTTTAAVDGQISGDQFEAALHNFKGNAPLVPSSGRLVGHVSEDRKDISGDWSTDIGTHGRFQISKDESEAQVIPRNDEATAQVRPADEVWKFEFHQNQPIHSFCMQADDLRRLAEEFSDIAQRALKLEHESLTKRYTGVNLTVALRSTPKPSIEITSTDGKYVVVPDLSRFSIELVPKTIRSLHFLTYKQSPWFPSHGLQILLNNINGTDPNNLFGYVNVHGTDRDWVPATLERVQRIFREKSTRRRWLHTAMTGQSVLYAVVLPLAFWVLFRLMGHLPKIFTEVPLFSFGLFVYVYLACYQLFTRFLTYARWAFPLYEVRFAETQAFQSARTRVFAILFGVAIAVLYDLGKFFAFKFHLL